MLHYSRVIWETALESGLRLGRFADPDVLDVGSPEDDVLVHLVPRRHGSIGRSVLCTERSNFSESDSRFVGINGVENTSIANF